MSIPAFTKQGLLPNSIHECSLDDVEGIFGRFQRSDHRIFLTKKLKEYINELKQSGIATELIIDGSYVTTKDEPGDVDLILVLPEDYDYAQEVRPFEYNVISNRAVKRRYGFDVFTEKKGSDRYKHRLEFFHQVKEVPGIRKGLLRIIL